MPGVNLGAAWLSTHALSKRRRFCPLVSNPQTDTATAVENQRMTRRLLRLDNQGLTVATESPFPSEARLHAAIAAHPEVLPSEDLGLGPLVALAEELDFGHGPLDLLAVDPSGRLAIIEFKRGTENPDVRKVIAQLLDYGAALWRQTVESLTERINAGYVPLNQSLLAHVTVRLEALGVDFDPVVFLEGLAACLDRGDFVFLYVARDLDSRTKKVMTFLAEGPRMTFFAVEVDHFSEDATSAVMVPRTAFIPSWVALQTRAGSTPSPTLTDAMAQGSEAVREVIRLMEQLAPDLGLVIDNTKAARHFRPEKSRGGLSVYPSDGKAYWDISTFRRDGQDDVAEMFRTRLSALAGKDVAAQWPGVTCEALLADWSTSVESLIRPYFQAWAQHRRTLLA